MNNNNPPYRLLLDEDGEVLERFGLVVDGRDLWAMMMRKHNFAHPASVLIGPDCKIWWFYRGKNCRNGLLL